MSNERVGPSLRSLTDERNRIDHILAIVLVLSLLLLASVACAESAMDEITAEVALERLSSEHPPLYLDVRSASEYRAAHIPGALHVPHDQIAEHLSEIEAEGAKEIIVFCERGGRARVAASALEQLPGVRLLHMKGDMRGWRKNHYPTIRGEARHPKAASKEPRADPAPESK